MGMTEPGKAGGVGGVGQRKAEGNGGGFETTPLFILTIGFGEFV